LAKRWSRDPLDLTWFFDESKPQALQPEQMTGKLYDELYTNSTGKMNKPLFMVFLKRMRADHWLDHSDYVKTILDLLAYEYRYKVRIAYSDIDSAHGDEKLKETFEVYTVPQNFFCKPTEGEVMCYEMQALSITYKEIKNFIDEKYMDESFLKIDKIDESGLNEGFGVY